MMNKIKMLYIKSKQCGIYQHIVKLILVVFFFVPKNRLNYYIVIIVWYNFVKLKDVNE